MVKGEVKNYGRRTSIIKSENNNLKTDFGMKFGFCLMKKRIIKIRDCYSILSGFFTELFD